MSRLTTNKPVEEMSMLELAHNSCYVDDDGAARYRDFETDIDARQLARELMVDFGIWTPDMIEMSEDEKFDWAMLEELSNADVSEKMYADGLIPLFYRNLWAMADLREHLKAYEDLEGQLEKVYGECDGLLKKTVEHLVRHEGAEIGKPYKAILLTDEDVDKWHSYKSAEEQGLLLRLPCAKDTEVHKIINNTDACADCKHYSDFYGMDSMCDKGDITSNPRYADKPICEKQYFEIFTFVADLDCICRNIKDFGKTIFPTKEEAEAALEKMKSEV